MKAPKKRGWGEGGIDRLPSGRFRARLPVPGGRVQRTFSLETEARTWLADQITRRAAGLAVATPAALTVAEWAAEWLSGKKGTTGPGNWSNYDDQLRLYVLPHLGAVKLRDLTAARLKGWLAALEGDGVTAGMRRKAAGTLSTCLTDGVAEGKLPANPLRGKGVKRPRPTRAPVEVWTAEELRRFLAAAAGTRLSPAFVLLADTGMRPGELVALDWPDVDLDGGAVRIRRAAERGTGRLKEPKTAAGRRVVTVSAPTVAALEQHRRAMRAEGHPVGSDPVFVTPGGERVTPDALRGPFERAAAAAKVPRRKPYALRHTSATLLLAAGVNVRTVSRRLGHEDIAVTLRHYAGWLPDADQQAAAVMAGILSGEANGERGEKKG